MIFKKLFAGKQQNELSPEDELWNKFVDFAVANSLSDLCGPKKTAFIVFWYDAEVNNGGHLSYFDCFPEVPVDETMGALIEIGADHFAEIFKEAVSNGQADDYIKSDGEFGLSDPGLTELLQHYVILNAKQLGIE